MSGIVGIINSGAYLDPTLLQRMTDCLSLGGPDGCAVWRDTHVGLGHSLLHTSHPGNDVPQPFSLDGRTYVVADARIDGRAELVRDLREDGIRSAAAASDAELLLLAYRVWAEECVLHLLGDFAFAIWDAVRRQLFCARDHFGVKPFFFAALNDCFLFSNTQSALRLHPDVSIDLNDRAIADLLLFDFNQDQTTTTFADIRRLPPAHTLTLRQGIVRTRRYWSLPADGEVRCRDEHEYVDQFRDLLRIAVADRLPAGPTAIYMSGGLDSTALAALALEVEPERTPRTELHACTVVYDRLIPDEERQYAAIAAEALGLPLHYLAVDDHVPFQETATADACSAEPSTDPFPSITTESLRFASQFSPVALSGDGGDALLNGSPNYMMGLLKGLRWGRWVAELTTYVRSHRRLPPLGLRSCVKRCLGVRRPTPSFPQWLNPEFVKRFQLLERWREVNTEALPAHATHAEAYRLLSTPYWSWLFETMNPGTSSIPLEIRYPFFDVRVVNFVLALPALPWCADKWILRAAVNNRLPDAVRLRPKRPLNGNPLDAHIRRGAVRWLDHLDDMRPLAPYVNSEWIRQSAAAPHADPLLMRPIGLLNWLNHLAPCSSILEVNP